MYRPGPAFAVGLTALILGSMTVYLPTFRELIPLWNSQHSTVIEHSNGTSTVYDIVNDVKYVGTYQSRVEHYQNIFYAADTTGDNRFAPPVKITPARGSEIDSTSAGAWCPQGTGDVLPFTSRVTNVSEHCLSLRIARPRAVVPVARLPVIVYLHGGGHALGSAYEALYNPDGLVEQAADDGQPIIFVAINYRLGLFGFATSAALIEAKHTNVGLRDQRAGLEWVRDNIEAFGGDPGKVTVVGQSVGASDIGLQLTAFGGKHDAPFQRAVMMSGAPGLNFNTHSDLVSNNTASIAEQVNCVINGSTQSAGTVECLRNVPFEQLLNLSVSASRAARPPFGEAFFYPTYDGDFLPGRPSELVREGKCTKGISIIASWVTNDGAWYASPTTSTDEDVLASFGLWLYGLSKGTQEKLLELYPVSHFEHMVRSEYDGPISAQYYRAAQMNRDIWFTCPVLDFTWQYVKNGGAEASDVWLYEHNATRYASAFELMGVPMWRVAHLSDIPYVLNNRLLPDNSSQQLELSAMISRSIAQFANSGSPNDHPEGIQAWPAAFSGVSKKDLVREGPTRLNIELIGGPYGTRPITIVSESPHSGELSEGEAAVGWENLLERCKFINSAKMRAETGV